MTASAPENIARPEQVFERPGFPAARLTPLLRAGLAILTGLGIGLAVIVSTHYVENPKLVVGLVAGLAFILITMRWPELGILCLATMLSGLISLTWLPLLHLGPVSLNIYDIIHLLLLGLVFARAATRPGFRLYGSPLMLPLFLFVGAFLLSAANALLVFNVPFNPVLRTVRVLSIWIVFLPTLQLIRDDRALRRFLFGMLLFSLLLLVGILFPNKFEPFLPIEERTAATGELVYSGVTRVYFAGDMILYAMIPITVASLAMIKKGSQLWRMGLLGLLLFWALRTFFRQYWLTLFVVCLLLVLFLSGQERLRLLVRFTPALIAAGILAVVLLAAQPARVEQISYVFSDRIGSLLKNPLKREGSLHWRVIETHYALKKIEQYPLLGIGLANRYRPPMESEGDMYGDWAYKYIENGYLYIALMMGLVGLVPFLWLCAAYLWRIVSQYRLIRDDGYRAIFLGSGAAFLGMMACNIASPTFVIGTRLVFFPLSMAVCEVILRLQKEGQAHA